MAYFLSRRGYGSHPPALLQVKKWNQAYETFRHLLADGRDPAKFKNSLKNARDTFDAHLRRSGREGWKDPGTGGPGQLGVAATRVFETWEKRSDDELDLAIERLLSDREIIGALDEPNEPLPEIETLQISRGVVLSPTADPTGEGGSARPVPGLRHSAQSKRVGDRAESIVKALLVRELAPEAHETLVHHAAIGDTPGFDLSYDDTEGKIAVEVKGTISDSMVTFEMTSGELDAAGRLADRYHLYLVSRVDSPSPVCESFPNPCAVFDSKPIRFRMTKKRT